MLYVIDIGNTTIRGGVFQEGKKEPLLKANWRYDTDLAKSQNERQQLIKHLFAANKIDLKDINGIAVSSVVPSLRQTMIKTINTLFDQDPFWVTHQTAKIPLRIDIPDEVGADRLCNAVAAWEKWKTATIVVDFGTAITLDIITAKGEYGGGAIAPGSSAASRALANATAKLPCVEVVKTERVVGRNTKECIQAGLYYGTVGMVDTLVKLSQKEEGVAMKVVATGGLAKLFADDCKTIENTEEFLTLEGLYYIWKRNH